MSRLNPEHYRDQGGVSAVSIETETSSREQGKETLCLHSDWWIGLWKARRKNTTSKNEDVSGNNPEKVYSFVSRCLLPETPSQVLHLLSVCPLSFLHPLLSLMTLLRSYPSRTTGRQKMSFLPGVFQPLILPPSVCLHAPFTPVCVHFCVCVCEWVSEYGLHPLIVCQVKFS